MARPRSTAITTIVLAVLLPASALASDLPEGWGLLLGGSFSKITTNWPDPNRFTTDAAWDTSKTASHGFHTYYMSLFAESDEGYSEWALSRLFVDWAYGLAFVYDSENPHPDYSFLSTGLFGLYRKGWGRPLGDRARWGIGVDAGDYLVNSVALEDGYHIAVGPHMKLDYLVGGDMVARLIAGYDVSVAQGGGHDGADDIDKPRFLNLEARLLTGAGPFVQLSYLKVLPQETVSSRHDDPLTLSRWFLDVGWRWL